MLLQQEQAGRNLLQRNIENLMSDRLRRQQLEQQKSLAESTLKAKAAMQEQAIAAKMFSAKQLREDRKEAARLKFDRDKFLTQLRKEKDPLEKQKIEKDMELLDARINYLNAKREQAANGGDAANRAQERLYLSYLGKATSEAMQRLKLNKPDQLSSLATLMTAFQKGDVTTANQAETKLTQSMTPEQYEEYQSYIKDFFSRGGVPQEIRDKFSSTFTSNEDVNSNDDEINNNYEVGKVEEVPIVRIDKTHWILPINPSTGKRITWQDVEDTAEANGISVEEVLNIIGASYVNTGSK